MPRYDYRCPNCGIFEMDAGRDERQTEHVCGMTATRMPFSGAPYLNGQTVARAIPDPVYRQEAEQRDFTNSWGTAERSMEMIRKNVVVDAEGRKSIDMKAMNA